MSNHRTGFRRMVISLPQNIGNEVAIDAAAELAEVLNLELLANFIADSTLHELAGFPLRELRLPGEGWQTIDLAEITREMDRAAGIARRLFAAAVGRRAIKTSFDVVPGAEVTASHISAGDIVAIIEPAHPGERITRQFAGLLDAALATAGGILIVPRRIVRSAGPVVALATGAADPGIGPALEITAALKERLILAMPAPAPLAADVVSEARQLGVQIDQVKEGGLIGLFGLTPALTGAKERLRVLTHGRVPQDAYRLFSMLHGVPLLVIEPGRAQLAPKNKEVEAG